MVLRHVLGRQGLVGEAHVHDRRRVALGRAQVDQPALGDQVDPLAAQVELLDVVANFADVALGHLAQRSQVQLGIEVARVGHDRALAHRREMLTPEDVDVARRGNEQLAPGRRLGRRHHLEAVHQRLERPDRIHLDHGHVRAVPGHPGGDPLAHPAIPGNHDLPAGDQDVGRPQDPVERGLARPIAVVEEMLGLGLVDCDHWELEGPIGGHCLESDHPCGGLFSPGQDLGELRRSFLVEQPNQVAAVVHRDLGMRVRDRVEVRIVRGPVLAVPRIAADPVPGDQGGGHVVLGRERVGGSQGDLGAASPEGQHQVGRLGRDMEAGADAQAFERTLALEAFADQAQDGHLASRPLDPADALIGQAEVDDVVVRQVGRGGGHQGSVSLRGEKKRRSGPGRPGHAAPTRWTRRSSNRTCSW